MTGLVKFHTGVDIGASRGVLVNAAAAGKVIHAGWSGGYGRMVVVQHLGGFQTLYAHLSKMSVSEGDFVGAGALVGKVGATGRVTGPHLHFEVRVDGVPVDPERAFLVPRGCC